MKTPTLPCGVELVELVVVDDTASSTRSSSNASSCPRLAIFGCAVVVVIAVPRVAIIPDGKAPAASSGEHCRTEVNWCDPEQMEGRTDQMERGSVDAGIRCHGDGASADVISSEKATSVFGILDGSTSKLGFAENIFLQEASSSEIMESGAVFFRPKNLRLSRDRSSQFDSFNGGVDAEFV